MTPLERAAEAAEYTLRVEGCNYDGVAEKVARAVLEAVREPLPKHWAIKGIAVGGHEGRGKGEERWIYWSPEGGGWWSWGPIGWRKTFATREEAEKTCPEKAGPWMDMPQPGTVKYVRVPDPEEAAFTAMIDHILK